ncbi:MAG: hypothetical protein KKD28_13705 [Chloroflexi bacterium]|nr:hypothetical protein [Chloroflexota bacterium]
MQYEILRRQALETGENPNCNGLEQAFIESRGLAAFFAIYLICCSLYCFSYSLTLNGSYYTLCSPALHHTCPGGRCQGTQSPYGDDMRCKCQHAIDHPGEGVGGGHGGLGGTQPGAQTPIQRAEDAV